MKAPERVPTCRKPPSRPPRHGLPAGLLLILAAAPVAAAEPSAAAPSHPLRAALLLHAPFDGTPDARVAAGEPRLYATRSGGNRAEAQPGLPESGTVRLAGGEGRYGDALYFAQKSQETVFFRGPENLGYRPSGWEGACSFWLRLDPDADLPAGEYCDPLQFVAQGWNEGNMFVEFSRSHTPRHFRYAIMAVKHLWNPDNLDWEAMEKRPMVAVAKPPFRREAWTHVVFSFGNANTGERDGWGRLHLDGRRIGEFTGWQNSFNWDPASSALILGVNYVGWMDDLAVFNRPLTDDEVQQIHSAPDGIGGLLAR